jgi:two-component sensor histidine kinase
MDMWRIPASLTDSGSDTLLLDFVANQLKDPAGFLSKVNKLYAHPSVESFDVLEFKDGRFFERSSKPQEIKQKYVGRVWSFHDITETKRSERINAAVYGISELANMAENLEELFRSIHAAISELMPARNFYIALFDPETRMLSFPYHVDEYDAPPAPKPLSRGLTDYVLRKGEPLLADPVKFLELEKSGEVESIGAPSIDWLGVPLKVKDKTIGVMVVQTYTDGVRYSEKDRDMLMFVSTQAAIAIERKRAETTLRASLHEKEVLLKEIHHRVKNNMQVISSLLSLQSSHLTDKAAIEMFRESQRRIRSMALVHEKLYQSKDLSQIDFSMYIESLIMFLFDSCRVDSDLVRVKTEVRDVLLDINRAIPCGLIINELVMNSLKHAFPEGRKGEIVISLQPSGDGRLALSVSDDGVGFPAGLDFQKTETLGMQLVTMLVDQLDGTISLETKRGTRFNIIFRELKSKPRI